MKISQKDCFVTTYTLKKYQQIINECKEPFIELSGPTPEGYEFIDALGLRLPKKITVTNISNPITINPFGPDPQSYDVDSIADITNLPYPNNSVGMFLVSSPPLQINHANDLKHKTMSDYSISDFDKIDATKFTNLRIVLFINAAKALKANGLLIFQNIRPEDSKVAEKLGFTTLLSKK